MGVLILGRQTFPYKSVNVISKYQIIDSVSINTLLRFLLSPSLVHLSFTFSEFIVFCTLTCSTSFSLLAFLYTAYTKYLQYCVLSTAAF